MKKSLSLLMGAMMLVAVLACGISAYAGTSFSSATRISPDTDTYCYVYSNESEYFYFTAPSTGEYTIYSHDNSFDTYGVLYDSNEYQIDSNDDGGDGRNFSITCNLTAGHTYYIEVRGYSGSSGSCYVYIDAPVEPLGSFSSSACKVTIPNSSYTYKGTAIKPTPTVKYNGTTLSKSYYSVSYTNNKNAGIGKVTVTGKNGYTGSKSVTFTIKQKDIKNCKVTLGKTSYTYDGTAKKPSVKVMIGDKKISSSNYTVKYSNNKNAGTAKVILKGTDNLTGTKTVKFTIAKKKIGKVRIDTQRYNGKKKSPAVYYYKKVKATDYDGYQYTYDKRIVLKKDRDYTIKYSRTPTAIGSCTATVKLKGNYTGTHKIKFKIIPANVTNIKTKKRTTTSVSFSWSKVKGAQGYKIYRYNYKSNKWSLYKTQSGNTITVKRSTASDQDVYIKVVAYKTVSGTTYKSEEVYYYDYLKISKIKIRVKRTDFGRWETYFPYYGLYEYQVATDKKFSDIHSTWRGYTDSLVSYNYTSGKAYYVRARRCIYNKKGNLEVGPWSDVKKVVPY